MMTPYTPSEVIASMYSRPALTLASTTPSTNGTTAQAASAGAMARIGASRNRQLVRARRDDDFLDQQLEPSAIGCSSPSGPTRFGPMRTCIQPMTLRSASVR